MKPNDSKRYDRVKKRPYRKPRLRTIELSTEQVLGSGCFTESTSAVAQTTCGFSDCSM